MDRGESLEVASKPLEGIEGTASSEPSTPVAPGLDPTTSSPPPSPSPLSLHLSSFDSPATDAPVPPSKSDSVALSSLCNNYNAQLKISDSSDLPDSVSDDDILELMYENLLEVIVFSLQADDIQPTRVWSSDGCKTPLSVHCPNNVPDTCPGAPMKLSRKSRILDSSGLRRKLF